MRKSVVAIIILLISLFSNATAENADVLYLYIGSPNALSQNAKFMIDKSNEIAPFLQDGRSMVPLRFIAEHFGIEVYFDADNQTVELMSNPTIRITAYDKTIIVDGNKKILDVAPIINNGRLFVPLRAIVDILSKEILWDDGLIVVGSNGVLTVEDKKEILNKLGVVKDSDYDLNDLYQVKQNLRISIEDAKVDPKDALLKWKPDGSFEGIDYQSTERSNWPPSNHLNYVKTMTKAAYSKENPNFGNYDLRDKIKKSLEYWVDGNRATSDNWWYEQIGIPTTLVDILLFEPEGLSDDTVNALNKEASKGSIFTEKVSDRITERPVASTGGNLTDKLVTSFKIAIATNNEKELKDIIGLLENELRVFPKIRKDEFGEDAEGIKADYSFHQHVNQVQFGGYGEVFMSGVNTILKNTKNTKYFVNEKALNEYTNFILDGMQWVFRNEYKDITTTGRSFSRPNASKGIYGSVKNAVTILTGLTNIKRYDELMKLKKDRLSENGDKFTGNRYFWLSDFMAHKRDGYHIGLKLASNRTKLGEVINNENVWGYYMSDGVTIFQQNGNEYENIYPVWNWNRIPGTTTLQGGLKNLNNANEWLGEHLWNWTGNNSFVGGVSDGIYGAGVMDYTRDGMVAHKAWFLFDNEMVALGNGINTYTDMEVYTNMNQCLLNGDVVINKNGITYKAEQKAQTLKDLGYIYHNGIGYISKQDTELIIENRKGLWETINTSQKDKPEMKDVFELGIHHGKNPKNASYEYTVVLDTTNDEMAEYIKKSPTIVLQNDDKIQAVYNKELKLLQAVIWKAGNKITLPDGLTIATNKKCLLMVQQLDDGNLKITVSNPENLPKDLWVTVNKEYPCLTDRVVNENGNTIVKFRLNEGVYAGSSTMYHTKTGYSNFLK